MADSQRWTAAIGAVCLAASGLLGFAAIPAAASDGQEVAESQQAEQRGKSEEVRQDVDKKDAEGATVEESGADASNDSAGEADESAKTGSDGDDAEKGKAPKPSATKAKEKNPKVTICHRTNSVKNPYVMITVDANAIFRQGHDGHTGPIFKPGLKDQKIKWGDIIPPFDYTQKGEAKSYPGLNWTKQGRAIWKNDCQPVKKTHTPPPDGDKDGKVTICHRTNSVKNPYVIITVSVNAIFRQGHDGHTGPIFDPSLKDQKIKWGDIIPPFDYTVKGEAKSYPGLNWTEEGEAIWENDCKIVKPKPTPTKTKTPKPTDTETKTPKPPKTTPAAPPKPPAGRVPTGELPVTGAMLPGLLAAAAALAATGAGLLGYSRRKR